MGIIKDAKVNSVAADAQKAYAAGDAVFIAKLNIPASQFGTSGAVKDWPQMIAGIEAAGWRLEHWSMGIDNKARAEAYPLFRRA